MISFSLCAKKKEEKKRLSISITIRIGRSSGIQERNVNRMNEWMQKKNHQRSSRINLHSRLIYHIVRFFSQFNFSEMYLSVWKYWLRTFWFISFGSFSSQWHEDLKNAMSIDYYVVPKWRTSLRFFFALILFPNRGSEIHNLRIHFHSTEVMIISVYFPLDHIELILKKRLIRWGGDI